MSFYGLGLLGLFLVFFKKIPISSETQPIIFTIIVIIIFFKNGISKKSIKNNLVVIVSIIIIILVSIYSIYLNPSQIFPSIIEALKYLIPLIGYIVYYNRLGKINKKDIEILKVLPLCILIWSLAMEFRIPILYNLFYKLSKFFFYRSLSYDDGIRGIAIFGPEPSYYGIIAIYYLTFLEWAKIKGLIRENKYYYINILIIIFCSILTKSTYSILFIALFILYKVKLRKIALLAPIFIICFLLNKNIYQSRAVEALKNIIEAKNLSLKEKLFYADGSVGARFFFK